MPLSLSPSLSEAPIVSRLTVAFSLSNSEWRETEDGEASHQHHYHPPFVKSKPLSRDRRAPMSATTPPCRETLASE